MAYFTPNHIALSPPPQVLQYILSYLLDTPATDRKELYEVRFNANSFQTRLKLQWLGIRFAAGSKGRMYRRLA